MTCFFRMLIVVLLMEGSSASSASVHVNSTSDCLVCRGVDDSCYSYSCDGLCSDSPCPQVSASVQSLRFMAFVHFNRLGAVPSTMASASFITDITEKIIRAEKRAFLLTQAPRPEFGDL